MTVFRKEHQTSPFLLHLSQNTSSSTRDVPDTVRGDSYHRHIRSRVGHINGYGTDALREDKTTRGRMTSEKGRNRKRERKREREKEREKERTREQERERESKREKDEENERERESKREQERERERKREKERKRER